MSRKEKLAYRQGQKDMLMTILGCLAISTVAATMFAKAFMIF